MGTHWYCSAEWRPHALQQKQEDTAAGATLKLARLNPAADGHQTAAMVAHDTEVCYALLP